MSPLAEFGLVSVKTDLFQVLNGLSKLGSLLAKLMEVRKSDYSPKCKLLMSPSKLH